MPEKKKIGNVFSYYSKIGVAAINLTDSVKVGDRIAIQGATTNFEQTIDSMQIDRAPVNEAKAGDSIGVKVRDRVRPNDVVYKII